MKVAHGLESVFAAAELHHGLGDRRSQTAGEAIDAEESSPAGELL